MELATELEEYPKLLAVLYCDGYGVELLLVVYAGAVYSYLVVTGVESIVTVELGVDTAVEAVPCGCSVLDSRVDRPSVSSPLGEMLLDWARRSRSSRRRFSFLPVWGVSWISHSSLAATWEA